MINFRPTESCTSSTAKKTSSVVAAEKAISFISKGWREVKCSTEADLMLMKARANSFKNLALSFDREFEILFNSACFTLPVTSSSRSRSIDFMKRLHPKLSDVHRITSSPDSSKRVLEKWKPRAKVTIDLSAIKNAIMSEQFDDREGYRRGDLPIVNDFSWKLKGERVSNDDEEQLPRFWEPIRVFNKRLRELEKHNSSSEIIQGFVMKVKSSLKAICKEPDNTKEVPPLDFPELLAYLVRQSVPFLDNLGIKRDVSNKIVESLCTERRRKNRLLLIPEGDDISDYLDSRISSVIQSTGHRYEDKYNTSNGKRHVAIVTTASLPWMTGTAVNPLFRAAYLAKSKKQNITLLIPWLTKVDQELVYPNNITFTSPQEQEVYIRNWLEERVGFKTDFKISFYPGKFQKERRSIIPAGDTSKFISSKDADIAILEEPEHLNWYHHGTRWTNKFNHVIGIVHTNYLEYIKREKNGPLQAFFVKHINNIVTRAYCHKVLRLSAATQDLPKSVICNVHGVNPRFLTIGEKMAGKKESFSKGAYFLGKMVWAKGYRELIDLLSKQGNQLNDFKLDVYGNGEDAHEVETTAKKLNLNINFMKGKDHADDSLHSYKVFINPSVSDVLCTATAEALAMGKFVVCADHPSNNFFKSFPNCLVYNSPQDFLHKVREAMGRDPHPLTPEQRYNLSWEAATERFMECSDLDKILSNGLTRKSKLVDLSEVVDGGLAFAHYCFTGNELLRLCTGAVPGSRDYSKEHCVDLCLLPPHVENPVYGW